LFSLIAVGTELSTANCRDDSVGQAYIYYVKYCENHILLFKYMQGDPLPVKVNKLSSTKTQLPYDYYFLSYCKPQKIVNSAENLGEVLRGDRIENSVYNVRLHACCLLLKLDLQL